MIWGTGARGEGGGGVCHGVGVRNLDGNVVAAFLSSMYLYTAFDSVGFLIFDTIQHQERSKNVVNDSSFSFAIHITNSKLQCDLNILSIYDY